MAAVLFLPLRILGMDEGMIDGVGDRSCRVSPATRYHLLLLPLLEKMMWIFYLNSVVIERRRKSISFLKNRLLLLSLPQDLMISDSL